MNDPNGLILHQGTYHLFFQANPHGREWADMSWGHAVSPDLASWRELPVAIHRTEREMAFSGSVVWDRDNTSGLGAGGQGPLVALFTSAFDPDDPERHGEQCQSVAFSADDGLTWTRYPGNPVLARGSRDFRDPKVFWHEPTGRWVMVAVEAALQQVVVHTSTNLLDWTLASTFAPVAPEGQLFECPDLVEVPVEGTDATRWVLLLSVNPDGPAGGSGMRYYVGDFDGATFTPDAAGARWLDAGPDFYAGVSFAGTPRPTIIAWLSNWAYGLTTPTSPWQSAMSLARTLSLVPTASGPVLRQAPVLPPAPVAGVRLIEFAFGSEGVVELAWGASRLTMTRDAAGLVSLDRSAADPHGTHAGFARSLPVAGTSGLLVEDHGLVEVFLDEGLACVSMQTFPGASGPAAVRTSGEVTIRPHPLDGAAS